MPYIHGRTLDIGCGSGHLAALIDKDDYVGLDPDEESLVVARAQFPNHRFYTACDAAEEKFDTVVSLAVIEHVEDPEKFLRSLASYLERSAESRIVITTPHPRVDWVHDLGARAGLFSAHASDEHEELLDRAKLEDLCGRADLRLSDYKRFLFGANQVAVITRKDSSSLA